jgi:membrane protein
MEIPVTQVSADTRPTGRGRAFEVAGALADAWSRDRCSSKAAALAFYTIFSLAPILVIVVAVAGYFFDASYAAQEIVDQTRALIGEAGSRLLADLLEHSRSPHGGRVATLVALGVLFVGATGVFAELKESLDEIWQVERHRVSGVWALVRSRLLSFGLVLVLAFLLLVSLAVNATLALLMRHLSSLLGIAGTYVLQAVSLAVLLAVVTALFAAIYKLLPEVTLRWRDVTSAALLTALLFMFGNFAIGAYLGQLAVASTYGAAGSLAVLLLWVYYTAMIFFAGAELTRIWLIADDLPSAQFHWFRHAPARTA